MKDKEALKLALEALKHTHPSPLTSFYTIGDRDKAIKAIEEHLAQPKEPEKEPESIWIGRGQLREILNGNTLNAYCSSEQDRFADVQLYTTPPQRTWVGLDNDDLVWIYSNSDKVGQAISNTEAKLKEKNA